jgi:hypothetical protein
MPISTARRIQKEEMAILKILFFSTSARLPKTAQTSQQIIINHDKTCNRHLDPYKPWFPLFKLSGGTRGEIWMIEME